MKKMKNLHSVAKGHDGINVKNPYIAKLMGETVENLDYIWITEFYKDEDGKNNCLQVTWNVPDHIDSNNIKLRTYAISNIKRVQRAIPAPTPYQPCGVTFCHINSELSCRFRINNVSRGFHCFEDAETKFAVRLEQDTNKNYIPISVFSSLITVKSKRKISAKQRRSSDVEDEQPIKKKQKTITQISIPLIQPIPLSQIKENDYFDIFDVELKNELKNELKSYINEKIDEQTKQIQEKIDEQMGYFKDLLF
jgi:hypothetical protein